MENANAELLSSGRPENCFKEGSEAPEFALPNAGGRTVKLSELLTKGPVVAAFYRGAW
jgi:peroxiredoxin